MPLSGSYYYPGINKPGGADYGKVKLWDGNRVAEIDLADYLVTIDVGHHKIHEGKIFIVSDENGTLASGEYHTWVVKTPPSGSDNSLVHLYYHLDLDDKAKVELWEGPTFTGDLSGSQLTSHNANRPNTTEVDPTLWFESGSLATSGSLLEVHHAGTSGLGVTPGGGGNASNFLKEWILKPEETYVIKVTSEAAALHVAAVFQYYIQTQ
jgi:hypothetical protein